MSRIHNGMRPQDIVVLLKVATYNTDNWMMKDIAEALGISASEVSDSFNRSVIGGLISENKRFLMKGAILEFLKHGLPHVFPVLPGAVVKGMPTAHSAPPLSEHIRYNEVYVWPYAAGTEKGQSIQPLIASVPKACEKDDKLYTLMALTDTLRIGRAREKELAYEEIKKRL